MNEISLVIMAAGLGSRFGAPKQLVPVGPENEIFLDYAVKAAIEVEIKKVVIVTRSVLNEQLKEHLAQYQQSGLLIEMVNQDTFEPKREKPWGTGHAVVTALDRTDGSIIVMNADDYYGPTALRQILQGFDGETPAILAFRLKNTLPRSGSVSRGILSVENEKLLSIKETHEIRNEGNLIRSRDQASISSDTDVSMNLWALPSKSLNILKEQWSVFIASNSSEEESEFLLPLAIEEQRLNNQIEIDVIRTNESWIGITNPEDLDTARSALSRISE
jgi:choline kinase